MPPLPSGRDLKNPRLVFGVGEETTAPGFGQQNQTFRDCHHSGQADSRVHLVAFLNEWSRVMTDPNNIKLNLEIPAEPELTSDELELVFGGALPPVWHCDASAGDPVCTQK
jgi:hypothetical protein